MEILLVKIPGVRFDKAQAEDIRKLLTEDLDAAAVTIDVHAAVPSAETYVYFRPADAVPDQLLAALRERLARHYPAAQATALHAVQDIAGASHGKQSQWHYIVETDVLPEADADLNDWYNQEHLPGLASVPGTVRAQRFMNAQGSPRYHACYDLETLETFESPAWMAVRATDWSSRVRPHFRNTKRTMFKKIA
jgi:hypothetical protein